MPISHQQGGILSTRGGLAAFNIDDSPNAIHFALNLLKLAGSDRRSLRHIVWQNQLSSLIERRRIKVEFVLNLGGHHDEVVHVYI